MTQLYRRSVVLVEHSEELAKVFDAGGAPGQQVLSEFDYERVLGRRLVGTRPRAPAPNAAAARLAAVFGPVPVVVVLLHVGQRHF